MFPRQVQVQGRVQGQVQAEFGPRAQAKRGIWDLLRPWTCLRPSTLESPPPPHPRGLAGRGVRISPLVTWEGVDVPAAGPGVPAGRGDSTVFLGSSKTPLPRPDLCRPTLTTDWPACPGKPAHGWPMGAFSKGQMSCEPLPGPCLTCSQPRLPPSCPRPPPSSLAAVLGRQPGGREWALCTESRTGSGEQGAGTGRGLHPTGLGSGNRHPPPRDS